MICPNCKNTCKTSDKFCQHCGWDLQREQQRKQEDAESEFVPTIFLNTPPQDPSGLPPVANQSIARPPAKDLAAAPPRPAAVRSPSASYGTESPGLFNIWGPFAGYGTRRRHIGWLMDGQGESADDLQKSVELKFKERAIPKTRVLKRTLTARGLGVERRPYFILQRGLVSMGLYMAAYGRDLFISLVSYIKPPLSAFRVLIALVMLAFQVFMMFLYPIIMNSALEDVLAGVNLFGGAPDFSGLLMLTCLIGPLGLLNTLCLFLLSVYSAYKWLTEKDFLAALRVPPNEFNEDDLMVLEKAVEQTVRLALDDINLSFENFTRVDMTERVWRI